MSGSVLHKSNNHPLPNFRAIALCFFYTWNMSTVSCKLMRYSIHRWREISLRRCALHKNHNPPLPNCRFIALSYVSSLNYVWNISQWPQKISAWNVIGRSTLMYSSHTPFSKFVHLPSINNTCSAGDTNSTNWLVYYVILFHNTDNQTSNINECYFVQTTTPQKSPFNMKNNMN